MELSTADPVATSVQFYLAALLSNSAGREICRCFFCFVFFLSLLTNRCIKLSRAEQQTDGSVRCVKREMFCSGPSCVFGRDVSSAKRLNKAAVLHFFFLAKQPVLFVSPSQWNCVTWSPRERRKKLFKFMTLCIVEAHKQTCWKCTSTCMFLFNKSSDLNDETRCQRLTKWSVFWSASIRTTSFACADIHDSYLQLNCLAEVSEGVTAVTVKILITPNAEYEPIRGNVGGACVTCQTWCHNRG